MGGTLSTNTARLRTCQHGACNRTDPEIPPALEYSSVTVRGTCPWWVVYVRRHNHRARVSFEMIRSLPSMRCTSCESIRSEQAGTTMQAVKAEAASSRGISAVVVGAAAASSCGIVALSRELWYRLGAVSRL